MENLLEVVAERDRAVNLLERGEHEQEGRRWVVDAFGIGRWRTNTEHVEPMHVNEKWAESDIPRQTDWATPYKRVYRERLRDRDVEKRRKQDEEEERRMRILPPEEAVERWRRPLSSPCPRYWF